MRVALVGWLLVASACPKGGAGASGGAFRVFYPDAGVRGVQATKGARMQAKPAADCRSREGVEARWANTGTRVVEGELPPGLVIEDGAIAGAPTETGTWKVTVQFSGVTCASLPIDDQRVPVTIVVR